MLDYSEPVAKLIDEFKRLPGIGSKSAQRLAFYVLRRPLAEVEAFASALREVKEKIVFCSVCNNLTDVNPCLYCSNPKRDRSIICIVEEPYNLVAVEKNEHPRGHLKLEFLNLVTRLAGMEVTHQARTRVIFESYQQSPSPIFII